MTLIIESESRTHVTLLWSTQLRDSSKMSPVFTFQNRIFLFTLYCRYEWVKEISDIRITYKLALVHRVCERDVVLPLALTTTVCIVEKSVEYLSESRAAWDGKGHIWSSSRSAMENHLPGFDQWWRDTTFRIVIRTRQEKEVLKVQKIPSSQTCCPLSADLQKLMDEGLDSDLELRCGRQAIPAHRLILSARSEVFRAMLQSDMKEKSSGSVEIEDMEFPVLQSFLRYLYTGTLPDLTVELAKRLYEAGDKYRVKDLMERCAEFLKETLSMQNACELLVLADTRNDPGFKESVIAFILEREIPKEDPQWSQFCKDHPLLRLEVLNKYVWKH